MNKGENISKEIRRRTIVSFSVFVVLMVTGIILFFRLYNEPQHNENVQPTLRSALNVNEKIFNKFFSNSHEAKTFTAKQAVKNVRVNGDYGMDGTLDTATWRLRVARSPGDTLFVSITELKALPKTEVIFDFKCIEGWSQVTRWAGVRFSDFVHYYHLQPELAMNYCGMMTPDKAYYVGVDMESMMHPQTILCYEMNGKPLPQNQGYPLRLIIPVKYGVKHIKRIGTMYFSNERPKDYWAEQGYDYYTGL